jgi:uncharacterized tellurite resistance protein B-like protein
MISRIKNILLGAAGSPSSGGSTSDVAPVDDEHRAKVAICSLLLEIANFDGDFHDEEKRIVMELVRNKFGLEGNEADEIIELAEKERTESIDLWQFTKIINKSYDKKEKLHLLEMLWEVVYADGQLHGHEDFLVHKLAKLLKLEHKDLIGAKIKVKSNM